ncbi:MAG: type II secretion system F family protein [Nocardioidaceae bacterium]
MGLALGLALGVGVVLIWSAFTTDWAPRQRHRSLPRVSRSVWLTCLATGVLALVVAQVLTRTSTVAIAFALLAGYVPYALEVGRQRARRRERAEAWPDAVDNLASGVRAGLSLPEALAGLATRGPEPLREAFATFAADYQVTGRFGDALDRLEHHLADPVGDRVVEALRIAREVGGGDLGKLLRNLSGHLRDDARTRAELQARQAWAVNGARLAVAAPWLVLLMMSFQHDVISRYASTTGAIVLLCGGLLCVVAYRLMLRIATLPDERRVLS